MPARPQAPKNVRRILDFLSEHQAAIRRLLILTHDNPDPDSLASAFALRYLAKQIFGIHATIAYGGIIGRMENRNMVDILKIPAHPLRTSEMKKYPYAALVDTQPIFENNSFPKDRKAAMVIDQHPSVTRPNADLVVIEPTCGATCVILAEVLLSLHVEIPLRIATAIAYGILSETLHLHRGATSRVIKTYLKILPLCDMRAMARIQNPVRSQNFFKTLNRGIRDAVRYHRLIVSHLGFVENPDLVAQIADFLLTYKGMHWSLCTGRYEGRLHLSLRTNRLKAETGRILRYVLKESRRAGGHGTIAGGSLEVGENVSGKRWQKMEQAFTRRLIRRLRFPPRRKFEFAFRD
jgi:nanoRNase/pAp phosphatase (c-di-AMP/oligoRNAs hydrolase)